MLTNLYTINQTAEHRQLLDFYTNFTEQIMQLLSSDKLWDYCGQLGNIIDSSEDVNFNIELDSLMMRSLLLADFQMNTLKLTESTQQYWQEKHEKNFIMLMTTFSQLKVALEEKLDRKNVKIQASTMILNNELTQISYESKKVFNKKRSRNKSELVQ